ncbi:hypothetical protein D1871_08165 [Nakamurella silvestris]|nr:hypothetical protein D1871_08165 [Nakamurella silvestris]
MNAPGSTPDQETIQNLLARVARLEAIVDQLIGRTGGYPAAPVPPPHPPTTPAPPTYPATPYAGATYPAYADQNYSSPEYRVPTPPPPGQVPGVPADVVAAIRSGNKLMAIKLYRGHTGLGLKEAKESVEALERQL